MFFARLVKFHLGVEQRVIAEKLIKEFDNINRSFPGFRGNVYFFDDPNGEYRALNYWDTKNEAEQAHKVLFSKLETELKNFTNEKPIYKIFEVYDPFESNDIAYNHIKM